jgi:hypothetical protein
MIHTYDTVPSCARNNNIAGSVLFLTQSQVWRFFLIYISRLSHPTFLLSVKEKVTHNTDYGRVCTLLEKRLNDFLSPIEFNIIYRVRILHQLAVTPYHQ